MRQKFNRLLSFALLGAFITSSLYLKAPAQVRPIYDMGAIGLGQMLKRLQTTASVLHTGAHPDDEDSGLLAFLARHEQARTAYLSLNRGEGGQNVIGSELFEPLGIIRTEELLQARRLDGGEQFFTRVMDYGFSKKREEAARIWGEKETLGDMVRAIRLYRPLVIISRFTGTPADGHGQHQLAGYLTPIAFKAAADPKQFPEQLAEGLTVWQAKKLYVSQSFVQNANNVPTLTINTGEYDSLIGRSYFEIAMEGRTQHKSQEMGLLELRGKQNSGLRLLESTVAKSEKETSIFDGVDTSLAGIPKLVGLNDDFLNGELKNAQNAAAKAVENFDVLNPSKTIAPLTEGLKAIREARREIAEKSKQPATASLADTDFLLAQKEAEFSKALQTAAGVVVDALGDSETIVAGGKAGVAVRVFAPESTTAKVINISLKVPQGWDALAAPPPDVPTIGFRPRNENAFYASFFDVSVPPNAKPTEPYWLDKPRQNFNFDWSGDAVKNMPFQSPLITAEVKIDVGGQEFSIKKPVQYRYADDIRGEIRRDLNVVPKVAVGLESDLLVVPASIKAQKRRLVMTITNNSPNAVSGTARFNAPVGWTLSPNSAEFSLAKKNEKITLAFDVTIPLNAKIGDYKLTANATIDNQTYNQQMQEIAYPHIQTHRIFSDADVSAQVLDLKVAPVRVGYIMGSGDKVPEAIQRMGLSVMMLEEKDLSTGDLSKFDTIVVGIRASQVRPDFVENNSRLLDFVKNGGTLIVQYQQQEYVSQNLPPFPAKMDMVINGTQRISNVRVVDENAPVKILQPNNPVFNFPNKITSTDFANWVQERNLYNFSEFDAKYTPLLESHDEGEPENGGGMVYAEIGRGKYVYSSYSWFRQLPRGVPGAYRIFANMLSLPKSKVK
ncbi:MAG: PIG-L family deacetylase [Acidobacteria bacterium]|jgi:LmbE family N-acetylglucosaminyl deacetylase|nr:PIG-L family deacetylase [Acidobacteriota bacterium]